MSAAAAVHSTGAARSQRTHSHADTRAFKFQFRIDGSASKDPMRPNNLQVNPPSAPLRQNNVALDSSGDPVHIDARVFGRLSPELRRRRCSYDSNHLNLHKLSEGVGGGGPQSPGGGAGRALTRTLLCLHLVARLQSAAEGNGRRAVGGRRRRQVVDKAEFDAAASCDKAASLRRQTEAELLFPCARQPAAPTLMMPPIIGVSLGPGLGG